MGYNEITLVNDFINNGVSFFKDLNEEEEVYLRSKNPEHSKLISKLISLSKQTESSDNGFFSKRQITLMSCAKKAQGLFPQDIFFPDFLETLQMQYLDMEIEEVKPAKRKRRRFTLG